MPLGESATLQIHHHPDQDQCYHTINVNWECYHIFFIPLYKLLNLQLPIFSTSWHNMLSLRISAVYFVTFFLFFSLFFFSSDCLFMGFFPVDIFKSALLFQFYMCVSNNPAGFSVLPETITAQSPLQNSLHASHCYCIPHCKITIRSFCKNVRLI